jgi:hypothetical protein
MNEQGQKIIAAGAALVVAEPALHMFGAGVPGVIVGLAASAAAYLVVDDIHKARNNGRDATPAPVREKNPTIPGKPSLAYRLINGKSAREDGEMHTEPLPAGYPLDDLMAPRKKRKGMFLFSQVLEHFTPSLDKIYLGTLEDGTMLFCKAEDLCHVAIAGTTRGGKSSIERMLTAQLCYVGASVLILNPHYSRYILDKKEDWTPYEGNNEDGTPYLMYPPMECRSYDVIEHYLRQITEVLLPKRKDRFSRGLATGKPYFLVLDELPDIVKKVPGASGYLDEIVRQGAKYGIFAISASQDFLVKTLKLESGEARECYRSAYYVGDAPTTARILLGMQPAEIPESILGQGTVMLRNFQVMEKAGVASVPYVDNDSLYQLLGPSTFVPGAEYDEDEGDELVGRMMTREVDTEKLPTSTRRVAETSYAAYQARKTTHRVAASGPRVQGTPVRVQEAQRGQDDAEGGLRDDERSVLAAYRKGYKSGNAIAAITGLPGTRVNKHLNRLSALGLIDWQPKA